VLGVRPGRTATSFMPVGSPLRSPFVGREREIALLEAFLDQSQAGQGLVVGLVGVPGIGKSRLLTELRQRWSARGLPIVSGHCLAYGSLTPYLPVLDLLRDVCDITEDDDADALAARVCLGLQQSRLDPDAGVPFLLPLLGVAIPANSLAELSAEARKARTFEILRQLFLGRSQQQPLALAIEDLHWMDPTSEAWLTSLVERLAGAPLCLLTTYRPGYRSPWLEKSYMTQLALPALGAEASRQVVRNVLQQTPLSPALEQHILGKAEGNPLFLEELAHMVREQDGPAPILTIPDTIQAVLAERLERLSAADKRLLHAAAVIGEPLTVPLLQAVAGLPEEALSHSLAHLQAAEVLVVRGVVPTPLYTFKHIVTQEVAYQSIPVSTRQQYHQQVAQVLVEQWPTVVQTHPELLAQHYTGAGDTA